MDTFIFSGLLWPPQPRRSDGKPQILMWILMWKKGKNLVYLYVKLSILSIGGPRLIFMNSNKCPTMWLIKKWDVALSSRFVWRYSFSQLSIRNLGYLAVITFLPAYVWFKTPVIFQDRSFIVFKKKFSVRNLLLPHLSSQAVSTQYLANTKWKFHFHRA